MTADLSRTRLTAPQWELLMELGDRVGRFHCEPSYKPIAKLHSMGLVDRKEHSLSSPSYAITEAGRDALRAKHPARPSTQERPDD